ncbi:hypothetical protein T05_16512 [Trichinella murrelli]|uniref:Uncharacterized protein n=1 Tax=Trichinella murrelli TaxID=144512 RepID=A0A0V0T9B5_9BILA|nr:hypothetical protein T05_16512 [Trichinella murrelli]
MVVSIRVGKLPEACSCLHRRRSWFSDCLMKKARDRTEGKCKSQYGPSPNSDERVNNPVKEADESARGSGPLHGVR